MEKEEAKQIELLDLEIEDLLRFIISLTSTKAIQYLGVSVKQNKTQKKDLKRARDAIDTTTILVEKLESYINEDEKKELTQMISNLQLSYVRES
jgi:hypothetical protein